MPERRCERCGKLESRYMERCNDPSGHKFRDYCPTHDFFDCPFTHRWPS